MIPEASPEMTELLKRATRVRDRLAEIMTGRYSTDAKTTLILSWFDLALEHHQAILSLTRNQLYGSALSLVRPIFEMLYKAHWIGFCGTDKQAEKLLKDDNAIGLTMGTIVEQVDQKLGTEGFFTNLKKQSWEAMNSYTHSGILQLTRRFKDGKVQPNYDEGAIREAIESSTAAILTFGLLMTATPDRTKAADEVEKLIGSFANGVTPIGQ
jgi:hypothetical protein